MSEIDAVGQQTAKICKWGNSMGVRLPKALLRSARFQEGTSVKIEQTPKGILLSLEKKPRGKRKYTLRDLCKGMTPANSHAEFNWGGPVGKEVI